MREVYVFERLSFLFVCAIVWSVLNLFYTEIFFPPSSKSMTYTLFSSVPVLCFVQFPVNSSRRLQYTLAGWFCVLASTSGEHFSA